MASSEFGGQNYPALLTGGRSVEQDSAVREWSTKSERSDIVLKGRLHRSSANALFSSVSIAVVLASLLVAYLLLICYRHLSRGSLVGAPQRMLASNFPDDENEGCVDTSEDEDTAEPPPPNDIPPQPGNSSLPPMPQEVQQMIAGALHMLVRVTTEARDLAHSMNRYQTRSLVYRLTRLAAVELSGFAFLPPNLQPMRTWVAREYLALNGSLLNMHVRGSSTQRISRLLDYVNLLGEPPPDGFLTHYGTYEYNIIRQFRMFQAANLNVLNVLRELQLSVDPATKTIPRRRHDWALNIIEGLYLTRLRQIATNFFTRHWILDRQFRLHSVFFISKDSVITACAGGTLPLARELEKISETVRNCGGVPVQLPPPPDVDTPGQGPPQADTHSAGDQGLLTGGHGDDGLGAVGPAEFVPPHLTHSGIPADPQAPFPALGPFPSIPMQPFTGSFAPAFSSLQDLVTEEYEGPQQAGMSDTASSVETAGAYGESQDASTSSAHASTSEDGAVGGQTGTEDDESDELLQLIEDSLDWSTAFDEEEQGQLRETFWSMGKRGLSVKVARSFRTPLAHWGVRTLQVQRRRTSATSFSTASLLAVILVSLAAAYSLLVCYRHLSRASFVKDAPRILASNSPNDDKDCSDPPNNGDEDVPHGGPLPVPAEITMPPEVQQLMAKALRLLAEPAARCTAVAPYLPRPQRRLLVLRVTLIAAAELSGFALLPPTLQPLRAWVARQYLGLSSSILNIHSTGASRCAISRALDYIRALGEAPPPIFSPDSEAYARSMVANLRLFQIANFNVLNALNNILLMVSPHTGTAPNWVFGRGSHILHSVYVVRLRQILSSPYTRFWLVHQQNVRGDTFLFEAASMDVHAQAPGPLGPLRLEYESIFKAVASAKGVPLSPFPIQEDHDYSTSLAEWAGDSEQQSSGHAGAQDEGEAHAGHETPQESQHAAESATPFLPGAHQATSAVSTQVDSGSMQSSAGGLTPAAPKPDSSVAGTGSMLRQASPTHKSSHEGPAMPSDKSRESLVESSLPSSSEAGATGGHTEQEDEDDDDVLELVKASLDWSKAFDESGDVE
ncbi:hypothetical protein Emed_004227 [Eimeria media]